MPPATEKPAQEEKPFNVSALQTQKAQAVRLADKAKRDPALRKILVAGKASEATIRDLTAQLATANAGLATHQAEAKTAADALAALRKELADAQAELATAEASLGKAAGRIAELEKSEAAAEAEAAKLRKELAAALKKTAPASGS